MLVNRRTILSALGAGGLALPAMARAAQHRPTPNEALGPFYPVARPGDQDIDLTRIAGQDGRASGEIIEVSGRVLTQTGAPVSGAILDVWQANAAGRYNSPLDPNDAPLDPHFQGSAKFTTGPDGSWRIITVRPGAYAIGGGQFRTRHLHWDILSPQARLGTQSYFPGEALNEKDILLGPMLARGQAAESVVAREVGKRADGIMRYEWDIILLASV